jgi:hypothetical protein
VNRREMFDESWRSLARALPSMLEAVGALGGWARLRGEADRSPRPACFPTGPENPESPEDRGTEGRKE